MSVAERRSLPPGGTTEMRAMRDGWRLRSITWPAGPRGSILFIGGRGDFIEKYAESLWHWRDRGFGVAAFDWRGQGLSGRLGGTSDKGHSTGFDALVADLGEQVAWFRTVLPPPHFAVAHSMGGHLLLRHLRAKPDSIDRAVLLAPMLGLAAAPVGPWLARLIASVQVARGKAGDYAPGAGPAQTGDAVRGRRLSSDPDRVADEGWWGAHDPGLRIGGGDERLDRRRLRLARRVESAGCARSRDHSAADPDGGERPARRQRGGGATREAAARRAGRVDRARGARAVARGRRDP
jgi:lysophospholipase